MLFQRQGKEFTDFFPEKPNTNYRATKTCKFPLTTSQSIHLLKMLKTTAAVYIAQSKNSQ